MQHYDDISSFYAELWAAESTSMFGEIIIKTIQTHKKRNIRVMDAACGVGDFAALLKQNGFIVTGVDHSEGMLSVARKRYPEISFIKAPLQKLDATLGSFDVITCLYDSLNLIPPESLGTVFTQVSERLNENGLFIFDLNTDEGFRKRWNGVETFSTSAHILRVEKSYIPNEKIGKLTIFSTPREQSNMLDNFSRTEFTEYCHDTRFRAPVKTATFEEVDRFLIGDVTDKKVDIGREVFVLKKIEHLTEVKTLIG